MTSLPMYEDVLKKVGDTILQRKNSNETLNKVKRKIQAHKERLSAKPLTENFGRKEVRELRDTYNLTTLTDLNSAEAQKIIQAVDQFDEWCMTWRPIRR